MLSKKIKIVISSFLSIALVLGLFAGINLNVQAGSGDWQIVFDGNGATGGSTAPMTGITNGVVYQMPNCGFTKNGKQFLKWATEPDGTGMSWHAGDSLAPEGQEDFYSFLFGDSDSLTLYAIWSDDCRTFTVDFDGNGATGGSVPSQEGLKVGNKIVFPENNYTWANHTFLYWAIDTDGSAGFNYKPGNEVYLDNWLFSKTNEMTFYAVWRDNARNCQIIFDGNGATGGETASISYNISNFDDHVILPDCGYTNTGDTFLGWTNNRYGSSFRIQPGTSLTAEQVRSLFRKSDTAIMYADWQSGSTWTVAFDGNGATSGKTASINGLRNNSTLTLPQCGYSKSGYAFKGWRLPNTTGNSYLAPGTNVPMTMLGNSYQSQKEIRWYAVWEKVSNQGGSSKPASQPAKVGTVQAVNTAGESFTKDGSGEIRCYNKDGSQVKNDFKCDGVSTYFFQADGTAMKDRLTYHPDGVHVIYFDDQGHEVFSNFAHVKKAIAGNEVDDFCFFDVYGHLYVDVLTYDQAGQRIYYANPYGVMEVNKWFQFSNNVKWADGTPADANKNQFGFANYDGTLATNSWTYDFLGRWCYLQGNGAAFY